MNKEELENAFNETTDNAVKLLKENVELKNIIKEETYEFYREQTLLLTEENKELKDTKEHLEEYVHKQEEEIIKLKKRKVKKNV